MDNENFSAENQNFAVIKEKIIKTNELLQLYSEKNERLIKATQAFKQLKVKYEVNLAEVNRLKLDNERLNFNIRELKPKYEGNSKELIDIKEDYFKVEEKYQQHLIESQLAISELEEKIKHCICEKNFVTLSPTKHRKADEKIRELKEMCSDMREVESKLKNERDKVILENKELKNKNKEYLVEIEELKNKNRLSEQKISVLQGKVQKMELDLQAQLSLKESLHLLKKTHEAEIRSLKEDISKLSLENKRIQCLELECQILKNVNNNKVDVCIQTDNYYEPDEYQINSEVKLNNSSIQFSRENSQSPESLSYIFKEMIVPGALSPFSLSEALSDTEEPSLLSDQQPENDIQENAKGAIMIPDIIVTPPTPIIEKSLNMESFSLLQGDTTGSGSHESLISNCVNEINTPYGKTDEPTEPSPDICQNLYNNYENSMGNTTIEESETATTAVENRQSISNSPRSVKQASETLSRESIAEIHVKDKDISDTQRSYRQTLDNLDVICGSSPQKDSLKQKVIPSRPVRKFWIPYSNTFVKPKNRLYILKNSKMIKRKIKKKHEAKVDDSIIKALCTLQKNNINFTITNESNESRKPYDRCTPNITGKMDYPLFQRSETFEEIIKCWYKGCTADKNCMLLRNVPNEREPELLGFFNNKVQNTFAKTQVSRFQNSVDIQAVIDQLLNGLKELIHSKRDQSFVQTKKRKYKSKSVFTDFCSETETELERLFRSSADILSRNRQLLAAAKVQNWKTNGGLNFETESDMMVDSGLVTGTPKLDSDSLGSYSLRDSIDDMCVLSKVSKGNFKANGASEKETNSIDCNILDCVSSKGSGEGSCVQKTSELLSETSNNVQLYNVEAKHQLTPTKVDKFIVSLSESPNNKTKVTTIHKGIPELEGYDLQSNKYILTPCPTMISPLAPSVDSCNIYKDTSELESNFKSNKYILTPCPAMISPFAPSIYSGSKSSPEQSGVSNYSIDSISVSDSQHFPYMASNCSQNSAIILTNNKIPNIRECTHNFKDEQFSSYLDESKTYSDKEYFSLNPVEAILKNRMECNKDLVNNKDCFRIPSCPVINSTPLQGNPLPASENNTSRTLKRNVSENSITSSPLTVTSLNYSVSDSSFNDGLEYLQKKPNSFSNNFNTESFGIPRTSKIAKKIQFHSGDTEIVGSHIDLQTDKHKQCLSSPLNNIPLENKTETLNLKNEKSGLKIDSQFKTDIILENTVSTAEKSRNLSFNLSVGSADLEYTSDDIHISQLEESYGDDILQDHSYAKMSRSLDLPKDSQFLDIKKSVEFSYNSSINSEKENLAKTEDYLESNTSNSNIYPLYPVEKILNVSDNQRIKRKNNEKLTKSEESITETGYFLRNKSHSKDILPKNNCLNAGRKGNTEIQEVCKLDWKSSKKMNGKEILEVTKGPSDPCFINKISNSSKIQEQHNIFEKQFDINPFEKVNNPLSPNNCKKQVGSPTSVINRYCLRNKTQCPEALVDSNRNIRTKKDLITFKESNLIKVCRVRKHEKRCQSSNSYSSQDVYSINKSKSESELKTKETKRNVRLKEQVVNRKKRYKRISSHEYSSDSENEVLRNSLHSDNSSDVPNKKRNSNCKRKWLIESSESDDDTIKKHSSLSEESSLTLKLPVYESDNFSLPNRINDLESSKTVQRISANSASHNIDGGNTVKLGKDCSNFLTVKKRDFLNNAVFDLMSARSKIQEMLGQVKVSNQNSENEKLKKINVVQDILITKGQTVNLLSKVDSHNMLKNSLHSSSPIKQCQQSVNPYPNKRIKLNTNIKDSTPPDILSKVMHDMIKTGPKASVAKSAIKVLPNEVSQNVNVATKKLAYNSNLNQKIDQQSLKSSLTVAVDQPNVEQILDGPKSPDVLEFSEKIPKLIPTEKPTKMKESKVRVLFDKLMIYSNEEKVLDEVIGEFAFQELHYVAGIILEKLTLDYHDAADNTFPPGPIMTSTQRILMGFLVKLEKTTHPGIIDKFLYSAQIRIFNKNICELRIVQPITRLITAIHKWRKDINRMRTFVCDSFYFMGDFALPMLFTVLTMWPDVLPLESENEGNLMAKVIVQLCYLKGCNEAGYNLMPLRDLLHKYFGYPTERWNCEEIFQEILIQYIRNPSVRLSDYALLLFLKNKPTKWVYKKIKENLIPIFEHVPVENVNLKATLLILLGNICYGFNKSDDEDWSIILEMDNWFMNLDVDDADVTVKRAIHLARARLPRRVPKKVKKTATETTQQQTGKQKKQDVFSEMLESWQNYKTEKCETKISNSVASD